MWLHMLSFSVSFLAQHPKWRNQGKCTTWKFRFRRTVGSLLNPLWSCCLWYLCSHKEFTFSSKYRCCSSDRHHDTHPWFPYSLFKLYKTIWENMQVTGKKKNQQKELGIFNVWGGYYCRLLSSWGFMITASKYTLSIWDCFPLDSQHDMKKTAVLPSELF